MGQIGRTGSAQFGHALYVRHQQASKADNWPMPYSVVWEASAAAAKAAGVVALEENDAAAAVWWRAVAGGGGTSVETWWLARAQPNGKT